MNFPVTLLPNYLSDTLIITTSVPPRIDGLAASGVLWQASPASFLLDLPGIARYLVPMGKSIYVEPALDASEADVIRFLRTSPMAALVYQRGLLALHAAAICDERGAILIAGDSGAGKSTLLLALLRRGWSMLADDLTVIDRGETGHIEVKPSFPCVALWPDALDKQGFDSEALSLCDANRFGYVPQKQFATDAKPLRAVYWMGIHSSKNVEVEEMARGTYFRAAGALLYNSHVADTLCNRLSYMQQMASLAQSIPLYRLRRPRGRWSVEELADIVSA